MRNISLQQLFTAIFLFFCFSITTLAQSIIAPGLPSQSQGLREESSSQPVPSQGIVGDFEVRSFVSACRTFARYCDVRISVGTSKNIDSIEYSFVDEDDRTCKRKRYSTLNNRDIENLRKTSSKTNIDVRTDYERGLKYICFKLTVDDEVGYSIPIKLENFGERRGQPVLGGQQDISIPTTSKSKQRNPDLYLEVQGIICTNGDCEIKINAHANDGFERNGLSGGISTNSGICRTKKLNYTIRPEHEVEIDTKNLKTSFLLKKNTFGSLEGKIFCIRIEDAVGDLEFEKTYPISLNRFRSQAAYLLESSRVDDNLREGLNNRNEQSSSRKLGGDFFSNRGGGNNRETFQQKQRKTLTSRASDTSGRNSIGITAPSFNPSAIVRTEARRSPESRNANSRLESSVGTSNRNIIAQSFNPGAIVRTEARRSPESRNANSRLESSVGTSNRNIIAQSFNPVVIESVASESDTGLQARNLRTEASLGDRQSVINNIKQQIAALLIKLIELKRQSSGL